VLGGNPDPALVPALIGLPVPPMPQEIGWKDTVQALPNMVTRFLVRFAPTTVPSNAVAAHYEFDPNGGHGYVWHCHIVDHEDNEMMRPYSVLAQPGAPRSICKGGDLTCSCSTTDCVY
jgi:FtsP/CotA-like multicopper oxidase with cupredoxin domain